MKPSMIFALLPVVITALAACGGSVSLGGTTGAVEKKACTQPAGCTGPAPKSANFLCADGVTTGGPACLEENGACSWSIVTCAGLDGGGAPDSGPGDQDGGEAPTDVACTQAAGCTDPMPGAPNKLCSDGVNSSGPACREANGKCFWKMMDCPATNACDKYNLPACDVGCNMLPTFSCVVGSTCTSETSIQTCPNGTWQGQPADFSHADCHKFCKSN